MQTFFANDDMLFIDVMQTFVFQAFPKDNNNSQMLWIFMRIPKNNPTTQNAYLKAQSQRLDSFCRLLQLSFLKIGN